MTNRTPGVLDVMQCATTTGERCEGHGAGHSMALIQQRVTAATPSKWRDGIVRSVTAEGWIAVDLLGSGNTVWAWNHEDRTKTLLTGEPVAVHELYHTIAIGPERVNVLIAASIS